MDKYIKYWGKAKQSEKGEWACHLLPYHCLDVAAVGRIIMGASPQLQRMAKLLNISDKKLFDWLTFLFAVHDIGKFSNGFQALNPELCKLLHSETIRANYQEKHWSIGYRFLTDKAINEKIFPGANINLLKYWYSATTGHHGRPPQLNINPQPMQFQFPPDVEDTTNFIMELKKIFSVNAPPFNNEVDYYKVLPRVSWLVSGTTMLSDWVGSNPEWFPFLTKDIPLKEYFEKIALKQAEIAVNESGLLPIPAVSLAKDINKLFPEIKNFTNLQKTANEIEIDNKPQLFILEEETGRGKTEAALTLAHRIMSKGLADGIYFALPTMATANAMFERVDKVYKKYYSETANPSFILAHSASKMYLQLERTINDTEIESNEDNINQDCPFWIADNRKKALLADVGVGTIDQALLAILQARHQALRLLGLSRKVLIVDEVHACDNYVHTLLRNLLKFHAAQGESAILLSATLPVNMRKELIESFAAGMELGYNGKPGNGYPLMTKCSASGYCEIPIEREKKSRKVKVKTTNRAEDVLAELKKVIESGRCACWVRNTVYDALEAYKNAQKVFNKENIILFHARFALGDRLDIETEILKKFGPNSVCNQRKGKLVIATQVVEQSLDIDFDFIVSDLAPIDLIIQRAGRLCRHNRDGAGNRIDNTDERGEPVMAVFMPVMDDKPKDDWYKNLFPKGSRVYQHQGQLWLTAKWLTAHGGITMPDDAREMVEYVYGEEGKKDIPEIFERGDNKADGNAKAAASMANFNGLKLEVGYMPDDVRWIEDDNAPTRLGEPTVLVRLAISENGKLVPLIRKGQGAGWELSQVSVYRKLLAFEDESKKQEISAAKEEMPDKGKYCLLIPLEKSSDGWSGKALNNQSQNVTIYYNNKTGLQIVKGEEDELD